MTYAWHMSPHIQLKIKKCNKSLLAWWLHVYNDHRRLLQIITLIRSYMHIFMIQAHDVRCVKNSYHALEEHQLAYCSVPHLPNSLFQYRLAYTWQVDSLAIQSKQKLGLNVAFYTIDFILEIAVNKRIIRIIHIHGRMRDHAIEKRYASMPKSFINRMSSCTKLTCHSQIVFK